MSLAMEQREAMMWLEIDRQSKLPTPITPALDEMDAGHDIHPNGECRHKVNSATGKDGI